MGEDWFLHFQDKECYGRVVHLQPVIWRDNWPVMGIDKDNDYCGEPVITYRKWSKDADKMHFSFNKEKGNRTLGLDVTASAPVEFRSEKIENPDKPTPERLAFSFAQPVVEATISAVFSAHGIGRAAWRYRKMDFGLSDGRMDSVREELLKYL